MLGASLVVQMVKSLLAIWETWVWSLGWEDPLEKRMTTNSSILAWRIPWTAKTDGLQSMGSQRVGHNWVMNTFTFLALNLNLSMMAHACESHWRHTSKNLENHIPHNVALAEHQCPVAYPHNGAPLGLLKGMQLWINTNEPWDYYAKGKRPGTKGHAWYDSIYVKDLEQANS